MYTRFYSLTWAILAQKVHGLTSWKRLHPPSVINTTVYSSGSSIDYATRVARILARRTALPVYVGCSMNFAGLMVEEEMEGLSKLIDTIMTQFKELQ